MNGFVFALVYFVSIVGMQSCLADEWTPPENPVPKEILEEAEKDVKNRRYDVALVKQQWLVDNALQYQPSLKGLRVRAIDEWNQLSKVYPPARTALIEKRDQSRELVSALDDVIEPFLVMATINNKLSEYELTVRVFQEVEETSPDQARQLFGLARHALTEQGEYKTVSRYLDDPLTHLEKEFESHRMMLEFSNSPKIQGHPLAAEWVKTGNRTANQHLIKNVSMLVAILAVNERHDEAELVVKTTRERYPYFSDLHLNLEKALAGEFPKAEHSSVH